VLRNNSYSEQIQATTLNPCSLDVMTQVPYYCKILPDIIRCFQKLPLIRDRTTVLVAAEYWADDSDPYPHFPISDRRAMAETVRELLLQRTPVVVKKKKQPKPAPRKGERQSQRLKGAK
jgi:hypothetical protein